MWVKKWLSHLRTSTCACLQRVNEVHQIDLTDMQQTMLSDGYYLQQNDLVYVTPNDKRKRDSTNTGNIFHTPYIWMSIISMLASLIAIFK